MLCLSDQIYCSKNIHLDSNSQIIFHQIHIELEKNPTRIQEECRILYEIFDKNLVCNGHFINKNYFNSILKL